jgi:hypothetical protein
MNPFQGPCSCRTGCMCQERSAALRHPGLAPNFRTAPMTGACGVETPCVRPVPKTARPAMVHNSLYGLHPAPVVFHGVVRAIECSTLSREPWVANSVG